MAATVTGTEQVVTATIGGGPQSRGGNGFHKNGGGHADDDGRPGRYFPARYRIGAWVAIGSIVLLFVALSSAYIVRSASGSDWRPIAMPKVLWLSTAIILASNPHSSFFYLFTAAHGLHLLGGILALSYLLLRTRQRRATIEGELRRVGAAEAATIYWHFMDGLWVCLFLLL